MRHTFFHSVLCHSWYSCENDDITVKTMWKSFALQWFHYSGSWTYLWISYSLVFSTVHCLSRSLHLYSVSRVLFFFFYNSFFNCIISNKELSRFLFYFTNFAVCNDFYCVCICGELVVWAQIHHLVIWCSLYCFFDLFSFLKNWAVTNILHLPILLINKNENKWYFVHWMLINHLYTYFSFVFAHLLFPMGTFISLWWDPFLKTASSLSIIALYIWLEIAFSFITISSYMYLYVRKKIISVSSSVVNIILSYCFISSLWTLNLELVTHLDNTQYSFMSLYTLVLDSHIILFHKLFWNTTLDLISFLLTIYIT